MRLFLTFLTVFIYSNTSAQFLINYSIGPNVSIDLNSFRYGDLIDKSIGQSYGLRFFAERSKESPLCFTLDLSYSQKQSSFNYNDYPNIRRPMDNTTTQTTTSDGTYFNAYESKFKGEYFLVEPTINRKIIESDNFTWTAGTGVLVAFQLSEKFSGTYYHGKPAYPNDSIIDSGPLLYNYSGELDWDLNNVKKSIVNGLGLSINTEIKWIQNRYQLYVQTNLKAPLLWTQTGDNPYFIDDAQFQSLSLKFGIDYKI